MIRIGLLGAGGRMGTWVSRLLADEYSDRALLAAGASRGAALDSLLSTDAVIDFSSPSAALSHIEKAAASTGKLPAFVLGSTGWTPELRGRAEALAARAPVLMSSNFSTGVCALLNILREAAPRLERLGYTPAIVDTHHRHKKDSPSGTAIAFQRALSPERPEAVQTVSIRAGEVIGDHEITFYGPSDRLVFGHFAQDRSIFARGAIDVALWLAGRKAAGKILSMDDYLQEHAS